MARHGIGSIAACSTNPTTSAAGRSSFYAANKIARWSKATPGGRLIVTEDGPKKGLDSPAIGELIETLWGR